MANQELTSILTELTSRAANIQNPELQAIVAELQARAGDVGDLPSIVTEEQGPVGGKTAEFDVSSTIPATPMEELGETGEPTINLGETSLFGKVPIDPTSAVVETGKGALNLAKEHPVETSALAASLLIPGPDEAAVLPLALRAMRIGNVAAGTRAIEKLIKDGLEGETVLSFASDIAGDFVREGGLEFGIDVGLSTVKKFAAPFAKSIRPEAEALEATLTKHGFDASKVLESTDIVESGLQNFMRNFTGGIPGAGGEITAKEKLKDEVAERLINHTKRSFGGKLPVDVAGDIVQGTFESNSLFLSNLASNLYGTVDNLIGDAAVDIRPLKKWAQSLDTKIKSSFKEGSKKTNLLRQKGDDYLEGVQELDDFLTFEQATIWRSRFLSAVRALENAKEGASKGIASKLAGDFHKQLEVAGKGLKADPATKEAFALWEEANMLWLQKEEIFGKPLIKKIAKDDPDLIADLIFKKRRPSNVRQVKQALGYGSPDPQVVESAKEAFANIRGGMIQNWIEDSMDDEGVHVASKILKKFRQLGTKTLNETWKPEEWKSILEALKGAKALQTASKGDKAGGLAGTFLFVGGVAQALQLKSKAMGRLLTITIGSKKWGQFANSKIGQKWLTTGWQLGFESRASLSLLSRTIEVGLEEGWLEEGDIDFPEGKPLQFGQKSANTTNANTRRQ